MDCYGKYKQNKSHCSECKVKKYCEQSRDIRPIPHNNFVEGQIQPQWDNFVYFDEAEKVENKLSEELSLIISLLDSIRDYKMLRIFAGRVAGRTYDDIARELNITRQNACKRMLLFVQRNIPSGANFLFPRRKKLKK